MTNTKQSDRTLATGNSPGDDVHLPIVDIDSCRRNAAGTAPNSIDQNVRKIRDTARVYALVLGVPLSQPGSSYLAA